ncbi:MAG: dTDP-glucose 4,6-dehydratase [Methylobacterium sp.]|nr:MAG: dTDP-glucose 4,6-dehydratase [Methylobacterium sp.]
MTQSADRSANAPLSVQYEESEDLGSNTSANATLGDVIAVRYDRRDLLKGLLGCTAIAATVSPVALMVAEEARAQGANTTPSFNFKEIAAGSDERHHVAEGYDADILIRWGDAVVPGAPAFDPLGQTGAAQAKQFGYNNDFLGFAPIDGKSDHGLLVVNHEYTNEELMFPKLGRQDTTAKFAGMTKELAEVEMMAHGGSVIEIRRQNGKWGVVPNSTFARRITADTPMVVTGPAAGHDLMKTNADPTGTKVLGMLNNCAGAMTPWGTWLTCEENFNGYFWGKAEGANEKALKRYGAPGNWYNWGQYFDRFDVAKEPNEVNRFGWVVEIDPFDPNSVPKKRTALGRFKHEGAGNIVNRDGRFVVYSGDDERFDYVYKFVSEGTVNTTNRAANADLLDKGTLYVAKYNADGTGNWLPLVHGQGPLTAANGFPDQATVLVQARLAADALGATKMDRPEDIDVNPRNGKAYLMLTNNSRRRPEQVDAANPRADNKFGHIIEMEPDGGDHAALAFKWNILVRCGDPSVAAVGATFHPNTTKDGWFGMPDNCAVDNAGRLWVSTDGNSPAATGRADGVWAMETDGAARGTSKLFFRCPNGAEMCGPYFTPDDETFFVAVQHPGEADDDAKEPATFEKPSTRWPDFKDGMPPRPSVIAITKRGGGKIG